jgi:hypothetical protein
MLCAMGWHSLRTSSTVSARGLFENRIRTRRATTSQSGSDEMTEVCFGLTFSRALANSYLVKSKVTVYSQ